MQGLGPDSAACIQRYRRLAALADPAPVRQFLAELVNRGEEKFIQLIITSKVARIPDREREFDLLEFLYESPQLPLYLRLYANTRCCYKVSNAPDPARAVRYLDRGYRCLHQRQACGSSDTSKRDRLHLGFSAMLALQHVHLTHRQWREAQALGQGAMAEIARLPEGSSLTDAYYGTTTRIGRLIAIQYALDIALDQNLEGATRYAALLRQSLGLALQRADLNLVRFDEFNQVLPAYRWIVQSQARKDTPDRTITQLVKLAVIIKRQGRRRVLKQLRRQWRKGAAVD